MKSRELDGWTIFWSLVGGIAFGIWQSNTFAGLFVAAIGFLVNNCICRLIEPPTSDTSQGEKHD